MRGTGSCVPFSPLGGRPFGLLSLHKRPPLLQKRLLWFRVRNIVLPNFFPFLRTCFSGRISWSPNLPFRTAAFDPAVIFA